jgi:primary-amine oxidase
VFFADYRRYEFRPVETHQIHLKPADFFTCNPAIDVPSSRNMTSKLHNSDTPSPQRVMGYSTVDVEHRKISMADENIQARNSPQQQQAIRACCM